MAIFNTYYINGESLITATAVFSDAEMTTLAAAGYYSDGNVIRYQNPNPSNSQVLFDDQSHICDSCTSECEDDIIFSQTNSLSSSLQGSVSFGSTQGAIKVEIRGVNNRPIGVDLSFNGSKYNYFSSTIATAGRYNAPNLNSKSYFWSVNGVGDCKNWTTGNANLDILYFNPILGIWEATGDRIISQSLSNKMQTGFPAYTGSVGSTAGSLITYIPKDSNNTNLLLDVIFETPCGSYQGRGSVGPVLSVSCPVQLSSFASSVVSSAGHSNACTYSTINQQRYIGPVRSTSAGVLAKGDFLFNNINGTNPTADGYYKASGAKLEGVSSSASGSFRVVNGIVTEIQTC